MSKIKSFLIKFKWYIILAFCIFLTYVFRAFGKEDKKPHYKEIVDTYKNQHQEKITKQLEELQTKRDNDSVREIESLEKSNQELLKELEERQETGRFSEAAPKERNAREALNELEKLGF